MEIIMGKNDYEIAEITDTFLKKLWKKDLLMFFFRPITFYSSNTGWKEYYNHITDEITNDKDLSDEQKKQLFKYFHKKDALIFFRYPIYYTIVVVLFFGSVFITKGPSAPIFSPEFLGEFIIASIVMMLARIFWING